MIDRMILTLHKVSNSMATASVVFTDEDNTEDFIIINKMQIDLNDGANPIVIPKMAGVAVAQGTLVEDAKAFALYQFQNGADKQPGIYNFVHKIWEE